MDKTKIAIKVFDHFAKTYEEKFMDISLYENTLDLFCDFVKKENAEILELACGPGNITKYLLAKRPDFKILGTDLSEKVLELAKKNNPQAKFQLLDCREINGLQQKYDGVMAGFCLPYLSKEEAIILIKNSKEILNPGGVLYLSTMEDDYGKSGFKPSSSGGDLMAYIHYHEGDYLASALQESGFDIANISRQAYPEGDVTDLIIVAKKSGEA